MSNLQTQSLTNAPVYEKHELEKILKMLSEKVEYLTELLEKAERSISEIHYILYYKTDIDIEIIDEIAKISRKLKSRVYDAIEELVISELQLDTDIEKYERQYNVKFSYDVERQLGVVLLKENDTTKPVVIWTDYSTVDYYEGERNE